MPGPKDLARRIEAAVIVAVTIAGTALALTGWICPNCFG
jgi:hypothetical protein